MKVTFSQIFFTDVPFLIHVISFEVVITPLLTRLFLSHTDAQASSLLIFHTSLWLVFFFFLDLVRIWDDKNTCVLAAAIAFSLFPALSSSLTLSYSPFSSSLWFSACSPLMSLMTPPPFVSHLFPSQSFLLYSFIFPLALHLSLLPSLLSFLLCSSSLLAIAVGVLSRD